LPTILSYEAERSIARVALEPRVYAFLLRPRRKITPMLIAALLLRYPAAFFSDPAAIFIFAMSNVKHKGEPLSGKCRGQNALQEIGFSRAYAIIAIAFFEQLVNRKTLLS